MAQLPSLTTPRTLLVAGLAALGLAVAPAAASATDLFVAPTGADSGGCAQKVPCKTIGYAMGTTIGGDRVIVNAGTYNEQVTLQGGRTLIAAAGARPTIDGGAGNGITVTGSGARITGLRVRGDTRAILIDPGADHTTIVDNVFDDTAVNTSAKVAVGGGSGAVTLTGNQFFNVAAGNSFAIALNTTGAVDIGDNAIEDFWKAISLRNYGGSPAVVHGNTISGVHGGAGIEVFGSATVSDNLIGGIGSDSSVNGAHGLAVYDDDIAPDLVPAVGTSRRNRIFGFGFSGILASVRLAGSSFTSTGDLVSHNGVGISVYGHASVTGMTAADSDADELYLGTPESSLTLRSSVVGAGGIGTNNPSATCTISHSRGPAITGDDCAAFTTSADPQFAGPGDYHLKATSPLLDAGDPAVPASGETDLDGHARAIAASAGTACAPRRDMGAYEYAPLNPFDCPKEIDPGTDPKTDGPGTPPADPQPGPGDIPLSPPAVNVGVVVLSDAGVPLTSAVDGAKAAKLAGRTAGATTLRPVGAHTVKVAPKRGRAGSVKVRLKAGQLAVVVATVSHGRVKLRTTIVAAGARRVVSLTAAAQRAKIGTASKATTLRNGVLVAVPKAATALRIGARTFVLATAAQLTVLLPKGKGVKAVARRA